MKNLKYIVLALIVALLAVLAFMVDMQDDTLDFIKNMESDIKGYADINPIKIILIFISLYALSIFLFLPIGIPMLLAGGMIFGAFEGAFWSSIGNLAGAVGAFLITRYVFYDDVRNFFPDKVKSIDKVMKEDGIFYMVIFRIAPMIPSELLNLLLGLTPVKLFHYVWVTLLARYPINYIYCTIGENLAEIDKMSDIFSWNLFLSLGALVLFLIAGKLAHVKYIKPKQTKAF